MKVLVNGRDKMSKKQITCLYCDSILEYDKLDIYTITDYNYPSYSFSHQPKGAREIDWIRCPVCNKEIEIAERKYDFP